MFIRKCLYSLLIYLLLCPRLLYPFVRHPVTFLSTIQHFRASLDTLGFFYLIFLDIFFWLCFMMMPFVLLALLTPLPPSRAPCPNLFLPISSWLLWRRRSFLLFKVRPILSPWDGSIIPFHWRCCLTPCTSSYHFIFLATPVVQ
ncbi:hypothetical protein BDZ97DRAFT_1798724 [Flammula alnicola]|nr:hypothetical protein BDZ97DRAFT_1798724 [Flammula alnicola]